MVQFYPSLTPSLRDWCLSQPLFFIASAPTHGTHINVSPKGLPATTFTILDPNTACYIDATGSGAETIAHVYENQRCTVMFCSFEKAPRILRLFCRGKVVEYDDEGFGVWTRRMGVEVPRGARAVIVLDIFKVQTSCGYGVPLLSTSSSLASLDPTDKTPSPLASTDAQTQSRLLDRETLGHWANQKVSQNGMEEYRALNNAHSLDGLPGLKAARRTRGETLWVGDVTAYLRRILRQWDAVCFGIFLVCFAGALLRLIGMKGSYIFP